MADNTKIEWTDATWNPITGCTLVDEGCRNCYAARLAATRLKHLPSREGLARLNAEGVAKFTGEVRFDEKALTQPMRWKRPRRIFVCAHGDLFHESVPDEWIDRIFAVMALAPQHTFQVLTKRPERAAEYFTRDADDGYMPAEARIEHRAKQIANIPRGKTLIGTMPWPHVWLGTSIHDQASADLRIPHLLAAPAAVRFISAEPLLGDVNIEEWLWIHWQGAHDEEPTRMQTLNWVIVGGESGPKARPMHPDWARSLRDQCAAAGVAFLFKQWGEWAPAEPTPDLRVRATMPGQNFDVWAWPDGTLDGWRTGSMSARVGKSAAGRLLDGVEHNGFPEGSWPPPLSPPCRALCRPLSSVNAAAIRAAGGEK